MKKDDNKVINEIKTVDDYFDLYKDNESVLERLKELREVIHSCSDGIEEKISFNMPCFSKEGILVYFGQFKNHIGFYPLPSGIMHFEEKFKQMNLKYSKGAVQFPNKNELPIELIKEIVEFRLVENLSKEK